MQNFFSGVRPILLQFLSPLMFCFILIQSPSQLQAQNIGLHDYILYKNQERTLYTLSILKPLLAETLLEEIAASAPNQAELKRAILKRELPKEGQNLLNCYKWFVEEYQKLAETGKHSFSQDLLKPLNQQLNNNKCKSFADKFLNSNKTVQGIFFSSLMNTEYYLDPFSKEQAVLNLIFVQLYVNSPYQFAAKEMAKLFQGSQIPFVQNRIQNMNQNAKWQGPLYKLTRALGTDTLTSLITGGGLLGFLKLTSIKSAALVSSIAHGGLIAQSLNGKSQLELQAKQKDILTQSKKRESKEIQGMEAEINSNWLKKQLGVDFFNSNSLSLIGNSYLHAFFNSLSRRDDFPFMEFFLQAEINDLGSPYHYQQQKLSLSLRNEIKNIRTQLSELKRKNLSGENWLTELSKIQNHIINNLYKNSYAAKNTYMLKMLLEDGGNCQSSTKLFVSLLWPNKDLIHPDFIFGVQYLPLHIQPVLYHKKSKHVVDLVSGKVEAKVLTPIYHPYALLHSILVKQHSPPPFKEKDYILVEPSNLNNYEKRLRELEQRGTNPTGSTQAASSATDAGSSIQADTFSVPENLFSDKPIDIPERAELAAAKLSLTPSEGKSTTYGQGAAWSPSVGRSLTQKARGESSHGTLDERCGDQVQIYSNPNQIPYEDLKTNFTNFRETDDRIKVVTICRGTRPDGSPILSFSVFVKDDDSRNKYLALKKPALELAAFEILAKLKRDLTNNLMNQIINHSPYQILISSLTKLSPEAEQKNYQALLSEEDFITSIKVSPKDLKLNTSPSPAKGKASSSLDQASSPLQGQNENLFDNRYEYSQAASDLSWELETFFEQQKLLEELIETARKVQIWKGLSPIEKERKRIMETQAPASILTEQEQNLKDQNLLINLLKDERLKTLNQLVWQFYKSLRENPGQVLAKLEGRGFKPEERLAVSGLLFPEYSLTTKTAESYGFFGQHQAIKQSIFKFLEAFGNPEEIGIRESLASARAGNKQIVATSTSGKQPALASGHQRLSVQLNSNLSGQNIEQSANKKTNGLCQERKTKQGDLEAPRPSRCSEEEEPSINQLFEPRYSLSMESFAFYQMEILLKLGIHERFQDGDPTSSGEGSSITNLADELRPNLQKIASRWDSSIESSQVRGDYSVVLNFLKKNLGHDLTQFKITGPRGPSLLTANMSEEIIWALNHFSQADSYFKTNASNDYTLDHSPNDRDLIKLPTTPKLGRYFRCRDKLKDWNQEKGSADELLKVAIPFSNCSESLLLN